MPLSPEQRDRLILLDRAHGVQELLRGMAHDVRNNLQVVALASQLGDSGRTPEIDLRVEQAIEEINQGLELLGSMGRHLNEGPKTVGLVELVRLLRRTVIYQRNIPAIPVRFGPHPDCRVQLPPPAALQVLLNLIANAKEVTPPDDSVEVGFRLAARIVEIDILDRGTGLTTAGEPLDSSQPTATHGGTGLFAARSLAVRFGGSVGWEPREGGGTLVRVSLPIGT